MAAEHRPEHATSKNESAGPAPPSISFPKSGGAIRGIGEKFAANPVTGTGSVTVPIATSPGRSGFGPQLTLSYDSGSGNGPFGFGWSLSVPTITRKTDKGLPQYRDAEESDVYILSGAEDLVPVLEPNGARFEDETTGPGYVIHRYRPRIEGLFARIERWTNIASGEIHWRSISRDNITTLYGQTNASRVFDPEDVDPQHPTRVFSWLICQSYDDKGNAVVYEYQRESSERIFEDTTGKFVAFAHEQNRNDSTRSANRYLKRIKYGNRAPNRDPATWHATDPRQLPNDTWMFEVVFDYAEGHYTEEAPNAERRVFARAQIDSPSGSHWAVRQDPFSTYRAGFEVRTYRLCRRVLMFHHFPNELGIQDCLVRSTEFSYAEGPVGSFITGVTQSGYVRQPAHDQTNRYLKKSLPRLEFEYSQVPDADALARQPVRDVEAESRENLPVGLDGGRYQWIDLDGEGISGILTEQAIGWYYKRNLSANNEVSGSGGLHVEARFGAIEVVTRKPAAGLADGGQFLDLAADGQVDLVQMEGPARGFYERTEEADWSPFQSFASWPDLDTHDPDLKFVDLTGDGHADILVTEGEVLTWYPSLAEEGFGPAVRIDLPLDEEKGPRLVFADGTQSIYLADLSGDGLTDLVRIRNGEVCYWPNLGYGRFGCKVTMHNSPWFDLTDLFDQRRIRLADTDGSGTTDILYLRRDGVQIYFNQSGNGWSDAVALTQFPAIDDISSVRAVDLLSNGTACLVWSSSLPTAARQPMRYLALMDEKPHLLTGMINNLGAETRVHYASSTKFYLDDKERGSIWITRLPFLVHVVERVETYDHVSRNYFVTRYAYHHGYFDGFEREFRGFGMVEQWDTQQFAALSKSDTVPEPTNVDAAAHVPPVRTKTWFHTGVYVGREHVSDFFGGLLDETDNGEYYREPGLTDEQAHACLLDDTVLPDGLSADEEREACRALKGSMLRQEVYALDGSDKEAHPYVVTEQNFTIERLQPTGDNRHAVFFTHPRESIGYHYERNPVDPRIQHALTLEVDEFGNVRKAAAIGYGRRTTIRVIDEQGETKEIPNPQLSELVELADREKQTQTLVTYTESTVTNAIGATNDYRTPLPADTRTYELTGYTPTGSAGLFKLSDFVQPDPNDVTGRKRVHIFDNEIKYEEKASGSKQRRLIEQVRTLYRPDDCGGARNDVLALLPVGQLESRALPGESYKLAFTPGLLDSVYQRPHADQAPEALLPDPTAVLGNQTAGQSGGYLQSQTLKADGRFLNTDADDHWWVPSGRAFLSPDAGATAAQELAYAREHFFLLHRYRNPFHTDAVSTESVITYDGHNLLMLETRDALENRVTAGERLPTADIDPAKPGNDYRVLQSRLIMDPNRNRSAVVFDALGMVVATAVMGKPEETVGDNLTDVETDLTQSQIDAFRDALDPHTLGTDVLRGATTRIVYDLDRFDRSHVAHPTDSTQWEPVYAVTLARETHASDSLPPQGLKIQISFSYSDGFGREVQKKIQAEPGKVQVEDVDGNITTVDTTPNLRWVGTGWTIFNNKGKAVRQYEPFFSTQHRFQFGRKVGVSPILFYDPVERVVATLHPNHTWEKVFFDPWRQETWDVNDTVTLSPSADDDVKGFFLNSNGTPRIAASDYTPTWYGLRTDPLNAAEFTARYPDAADRTNETAAAMKAAAHARTPSTVYFDTLGRPFLTVAHNKVVCPNHDLDGTEDKFGSRVELDIEGNQRAVHDERKLPVNHVPTGSLEQRIVMRSDYDMLGNRIHQASMEAGERWMLNDVAGKLLYSWDSREHGFRTAYDPLRRPTDSFLREGTATEIVVGRSVYGEMQATPEGKNLRGKVFQVRDQAGIVTSDEYDFKGNMLRSQRQLAQDYKASLDWSAAVPLQAETYRSRTRYDALNRPTQLIAPYSDQPGATINVVEPIFNEANLLERVHAWLNQNAEPAGWLDPDTAVLHAVTNLDYNAKGQRDFIEFGNGASTTYEYDPETFRLTSLRTTRTSDNAALQDLSYTYDPAGNITHIRDDAQQTIYFKNKEVQPSSDYTYDAIYRLIEATGREHLGQMGSAPIPHSYNDAPRVGLLQPGDGNAMGLYIERYVYDAVGNFLSMRHIGTDPANPGWTRTYSYNEASLLEPDKQSNRLSSTSVGNGSPITEEYEYDAHGDILHMLHLQSMQWDFKDQLRMTRRQKVNDADTDGVEHQGERTYYIYDLSGQRVRKVTELDSGQLKEERIYLAGFEVYRKNGGDPVVRETLHIMDDKQRIALVETRTQASDAAPQQLRRFQLGNHLGSASLELDDEAHVISYEEYISYGSTSYQAVRNQTDAPKRYRYTGRERDEDTGLSYHGARYYVPWLGRWASCDPAGLADGTNSYGYVHNNPTMEIDRDGWQSINPTKAPPPVYEKDEPPTESESVDVSSRTSPPVSRSSKPDQESPGVLRWLVNNTVGRVFDAMRSVWQGVGLAAKRLLQPIFRYGPGGLAAGVISAAATLLASGLIAVGTLGFVEPVSRPLTSEEIRLAHDAFGESIDLTQVRVKEGFSLHSLFVRSHHVVNYQIFGLSKQTTEDLFVHEMTHIWQEQHGDPIFPRLENPDYEWQADVIAGTPWERLGPEQQAEVLARAYSFERSLKEWEALKKEYATRPPLSKELEKIYGPRTLPARPSYIAGNIFTGIRDVSPYLLEALRKARAGEGAEGGI
jgi:RHS repeat-associated protein